MWKSSSTELVKDQVRNERHWNVKYDCCFRAWVSNSKNGENPEIGGKVLRISFKKKKKDDFWGQFQVHRKIKGTVQRFPTQPPSSPYY